MNRTDTIELELSKIEVRLLHNIIEDWLDRNIEDESEVVTMAARSIANELRNELAGVNGYAD